MNRRRIFKLLAAAPSLPLFPLSQAASGGLPIPKIKDVRVICTAPAGLRLSVVKISTDQDGLYGYGCATFTQRADLVTISVEKYLKPLLIGKDATRTEDIWQAAYNSSYWRNDGVLNSALSGVDQALWDIKGRLAGLPVYQLLGGKCREAAQCYVHAGGDEIAEVVASAQKLKSEGFEVIRVQVGVPNQAAYSSGGGRSYGGGAAPVALGRARTGALHDGAMFEPAPYIRRALQTFESCREALGNEVQLIHDVHERVHPIQALQFAKDAEVYKLFFLEDLLSPEDLQWFRTIRQHSTTPLAMGELFNNPNEWNTLISERLIDYIRIHVSQVGGLSAARKIAAFAEPFGVRTAWHGPGDVSPVGHAANLALDLACPNFGIRELVQFNDAVREVFTGCPETKGGYLYATEKPGWGIEVNEGAAAKYPLGSGEVGERKRLNGGWGEVRRKDGTIIKQ